MNRSELISYGEISLAIGSVLGAMERLDAAFPNFEKAKALVPGERRYATAWALAESAYVLLDNSYSCMAAVLKQAIPCTSCEDGTVVDDDGTEEGFTRPCGICHGRGYDLSELDEV